MAKSLRSKWKRKMKAEKRVRYGEKERARLDKMLSQFEEEQKEKAKDDMETQHAPQILGNPEQKDAKSSEDAMETVAAEGTTHAARSLRCEKGSYPVWVSNRKIQQMKGKKAKPEGKVNKRHKKKFL